MNKKKIKVILLSASAVLLLASVIICTAILSWKNDEKKPAGSTAPVVDMLTGSTDTSDTTATEAPAEPVTYTEMTLLSTGDLIGHTPVIRDAKIADGSYDFTQFTKYIQDIVTEADYAVFNLESTIVGDEYGFEGYPSFNMPVDTLKSMKKVGFEGKQARFFRPWSGAHR